MRKSVVTTAALFALMIVAVSMLPPATVGGAQVRSMATCDPGTNPDCGGGGGGSCSSGPCSCYSGRVVSITALCGVCSYDPIMRQYMYSGTWFVTRECCGDRCPCATITCWQGRSCGWCQ
jgi:hypothetical protein